MALAPARSREVDPNAWSTRLLDYLQPLIGPENPPVYYPLKWLGEGMDFVDPGGVTTPAAFGVVSAPGSAARAAAKWSGAGATGVTPAQLRAGARSGAQAARGPMEAAMAKMRAGGLEGASTNELIDRMRDLPGNAAARETWERAARMRANELAVARRAEALGVRPDAPIPLDVERQLVAERGAAAQEAAFTRVGAGERVAPMDLNPLGYVDEAAMIERAGLRPQVGSPALGSQISEAAADLAGRSRGVPVSEVLGESAPRYRAQVQPGAMQEAAARRAAALRAGPGGATAFGPPGGDLPLGRLPEPPPPPALAGGPPALPAGAAAAEGGADDLARIAANEARMKEIQAALKAQKIAQAKAAGATPPGSKPDPVKMMREAAARRLRPREAASKVKAPPEAPPVQGPPVEPTPIGQDVFAGWEYMGPAHGGPGQVFRHRSPAGDLPRFVAQGPAGHLTPGSPEWMDAWQQLQRHLTGGAPAPIADEIARLRAENARMRGVAESQRPPPRAAAPSPMEEAAARRAAAPPVPTGRTVQAGGLTFEQTGPGAYRDPRSGALVKRVEGGFEVTLPGGKPQKVQYLSEAGVLLKKGGK